MSHLLSFNSSGSLAEDQLSGSVTPYTTQSFSPQEADDGLKQATALLGTIGQTARDVGIAVGTVRREIGGAKEQYRTGEQIGRYPNRISSAWAAMSSAEKMMLGVGLVGIVVAVWAANKG